MIFLFKKHLDTIKLNQKELSSEEKKEKKFIEKEEKYKNIYIDGKEQPSGNYKIDFFMLYFFT